MAKLITATINLMKIDRTKIIEKGKSKWYRITIAVNDDQDKDQYGNNCSIVQGQTKEEQAAKEPKIYLGNGYVFWETPKAEAVKTAEPEHIADKNDGIDDLPF